MVIELNNSILAEADFVEMLPFLIFFGIAVISSIVKSAKKKKEESPSRRTPPRKTPQSSEWSKSQAQKEPEWVHVPAPEPPPVPVPVSAPQPIPIDRLQTRRNEPCEHPAAARAQSHVHREVSDVPKHAADAEQRTVRVDLSKPAKLRQAMILHEIFSSPLALREERPLWDE